MAKSETTKYEALAHRNEVGVGPVRPGDIVDFAAAGWEAPAIAHVLSKLFYRATGPLPEDVATELEKLGG